MRFLVVVTVEGGLAVVTPALNNSVLPPFSTSGAALEKGRSLEGVPLPEQYVRMKYYTVRYLR